MPNKLIKLNSSEFGSIYIHGELKTVKKYTWTNQNNIQVQVITYGARIHNIKMPDRRGTLLDVVLGFEDLQGYFYYSNHYFNSIIGRVTNRIENATFVLDGKQFTVSKNRDNDNYNSGYFGLDKVNFQSYQSGNKVIMSHILKEANDEYPGDMMVVITFELNVRNEFKTNIEAYCTKPTLCNISNLVYFNLAGSSTGSKELYEHIVQINANCYTLTKKDLPTGEIMNVVNTRFDFQVPTRLGNLIGIVEDDGYNQNFCINRGVDQDNCFAARVIHPQTGRVLEIYTNQPGLQFYTAENLGTGVSSSKEDGSLITLTALIHSEETRNFFAIVDRLHNHILKDGALVDSDDYKRLRILIAKLMKCERFGSQATTIDEELFENNEDLNMTNPDFALDCMLPPIELQYLLHLRTAANDAISLTDYSDVKEVIDKILTNNYAEDELELEDKIIQPDLNAEPTTETEKSGMKSVSPQTSVTIQEESKQHQNYKTHASAATVCEKTIPKHYQDGRVHGRYGTIYKRHGAFCMQTQNYPNAIYHKNFPNSILRPGEKYHHTTTYKFWIQPGNPTKYNHRINQKIKQAASV